MICWRCLLDDYQVNANTDEDNGGSASPPSGGAVSGNYNENCTVASDPDGHAPFIGSVGGTWIVSEGGGSLSITMDIGGQTIVLNGTIDGSGNISASGTGTIAGFPGTPVFFMGAYNSGTGTLAGILQIGGGTLPDTNGNGTNEDAQYNCTN